MITAMDESNGYTSDKISSRLTGLIAMFDLIGTGDRNIRDETLEDFAYFIMQELEWMDREVNKIK